MSTPPPIPPDQPSIPPVPSTPPAAVPPPVYSGVPSYQPSSPPYEAPIVPPKSTMGGGTKILLFGCLGIVLVGLLAMVLGGSWIWGKVQEIGKNPEKFVGETIAKTHPQVEFVSGDPGSKTITMRDKATGETLTARLEDVKGGRILLTKSDGTVVELGPNGLKATDQNGHQTQVGGEMAPPPDWVPRYPGKTSAVMSSRLNTDSSVKGVFVLTTADDTARTKETLNKILTDGGFTLQENADTPGVSIIKAAATSEGGAKREITAIITSVDGRTQVTLNYDQSLVEK